MQFDASLYSLLGGAAGMTELFWWVMGAFFKVVPSVLSLVHTILLVPWCFLYTPLTHHG